MIVQVLIALITFSLSGQLTARIVDVSSESTRDAKQGFALQAKGSFDSAKGNNNRQSYQASLTSRYGVGNHGFLLMANTEWGVLEGSKYLENDFIHGRYRYQLLTWLDWEIFLQKDRSRFRGLSDRNLVGSGPRFSHEGTAFQSYLGVMVMQENETYLPGVQDETEINSQRFSIYLSLKYQHSDTVTLFSTNYYQPKIDRAEEYRLISSSGMTVVLTERLDYEFSMSLSYDANPPGEIEKQDRRIRHGLNFKI